MCGINVNSSPPSNEWIKHFDSGCTTAMDAKTLRSLGPLTAAGAGATKSDKFKPPAVVP